MRRISKFLSLVLAVTLVLSQGYNVFAAAIPTQTIVKKSEFRAVWMPTTYNIDWPQISSTVTADQQKQQYMDKLDTLKSAGMNAVIFQVRPMGDAFYPSSYAPWSAFLTGTQGTSPGYDPLQFTLEEAHKRNMEFQAWFNPFRISDSGSFNVTDYINKLPSTSPLKAHPEWIVKYSGNGKTYFWLNPGIPDVRTYVENTILEVVNKYDIDGVHLDDYYYPYPITNTDYTVVDFPDNNEFASYGTGYTNKADWRRDNINKFISELYSKIKDSKSYVKFGVSPFGIWRNGTSVGGSDTNGFSSYDSIYSDSLKWVKSGWLDYIIPQIYWDFGNTAADYGKLIDWWTAQVSGKNISLYIGHAAYKIGDSTYGSHWTNPDEVPNQVNYNRQFDTIKGDAFYSSKDMLANKLGIMDRLRNDTYKYPALIPAMPWKDSTSPASPVIQNVQNTASGIQVQWLDKSSGDAAYFVLYRFGEDENINTADPSKIAAIVKKGTGSSYSFTDSSPDLSKTYVYVVTSADRLNNESVPSNKGSNNGINLYSITTDKPSPQKVYSQINITSNASGPSEILSKFSIYDGVSWRVLQDYSSSSNCSWTPVRAGNYTIRVEVKAPNSSNSSDSSMDLSYRVNGLYKVFVDPGHGGTDPGAIGFSGRSEKINTLSMGIKLRDLLNAYGFESITSREDDSAVDLYARAPMANNWKSNLFVSIHENSFSDPSVNGIETWYYPGSVNGGNLAAKVQNKLIQNTGANDRSTKTNTFVVLRDTDMPAILVETGFITNEQEENKLNSDAYQNVIANSILNGVMDYYGMQMEDINKDSAVDIMDLASMAKNYNIKTESSALEKYMDINNDGVIDIYDMVLVSKSIK